MLAINRCLELYDPFWTTVLFDGWKCWIWGSLSVIHASAIIIWTKPVLFSSIYVTWAFNPHVGYLDTGDTYHNIWHTTHNLSIVVALVFLYVTFFLILWRKIRQSTTSFTTQIWRNQKETYIQVFAICLVNGTAAAMYVMIQYIPVPEIIFLIAHYDWNLIHGAPAIIYLSVNKTIRKRFLGFIFKRRKVTINLTISSLRNVPLRNEPNTLK
uniref:7TM GPCR serpentine receptor class x (Srx) domain-containing protein n=1 Tax=Panagrolaimus sp. JU765 TaxID=591449 RepID=A0AC34QG15_9BILA